MALLLVGTVWLWSGVAVAGAFADVAGEPASFGAVRSHGSLAGLALSAPVVGMAATRSGAGYWLVAADGGVFAFGDAHFYGSMGGTHLNQPIVAMAATRDGHGYWLVARDGGVFAFGDARFYGSMGGTHLNQPVVAMAATRDGHGYWLVAADGGVFSFGDAGFYGSMGGTHLNQPVVAMAADPATGGYWLAAADGGVFSFHAPFHGATHSNSSVVGIAAAAKGHGYWLATADGSVYTFGAARFYGSMGGQVITNPITAIATDRAAERLLAVTDQPARPSTAVAVDSSVVRQPRLLPPLPKDDRLQCGRGEHRERNLLGVMGTTRGRRPRNLEIPGLCTELRARLTDPLSRDDHPLPSR